MPRPVQPKSRLRKRLLSKQERFAIKAQLRKEPDIAATTFLVSRHQLSQRNRRNWS